MEVGQVGFRKRKRCKYVEKVKKKKEILKPILKTMKEKFPNLKELFQKRLEEFKKERI